MKNLILIASLIASCLSLNAQEFLTRSFDFSNIRSVDISGVINVYLHHSSNEKVELKADSRVIDLYEIEIDGSELEVDMDGNGKKNLKGLKEAEIHIYTDKLQSMDISNVGKIETVTPLVFDDLNLDISGVGKTFLELKGNNINADFSVAGNIELKGAVKRINIDNSSVGNLNAEDLNAMYLNIDHSGVGNAHVFATEEISIDCSAVGNLTYSGEAKVKSLDSSGIGRVKKN